MVDLQQLAARAPKLGFGTSRLPDSTLTASILGIVCVNAVTLLVVLCLKYRHLLFTDSYPSKASLSPTVSHVEPLPEKHDATPAPAPAPAALSTELLPELDISSPFPDLERPEATRAQREQMAKDKELYHQLQNLEDHPTATDGARQRLIELLDRTVHEAKADPSGSIISIDRYSPLALQQFFQANHTASSHKYEAYIQRRWAGGPRELFPTYEYAVQWLKLAACVKYVDGSWVSNILNMGIDAVRCKEGDGGDRSRSSTPEREAAKLAWQVITEEFGDGDLAKNHVYLYYELIRSLDPAAQPGDVAGFDGLAPTEGAHRCWTAAIAQQCIGLMAGTDDFFPEALGFNMAYETLAYHLLVTSRELRELKIDDYYFALHITIDNPDSGHAALARVAVEHFLEGVRQRDGPEAMHAMWRRVQAGVILADGLPTTPAAPVEHERSAMDGLWYPKSNPIAALPAQPSSPIEREMMRLLTRKSLAAEKMHCSSRIRIEGLTVEEWLDPATWTDKKALDFLRALGRKRPWVIPGDKASSRLVRELEWGGRMFGAFSARETDLVRQWIGQLGRGNEAEGERGAYERYVGRSPAPARRNEETAVSADTRFIRYASQQLPTIPHEEVEAALGRLRSTKTFKSTPATTLHALRSHAEDLPLSLDSNELAALWFTLPALLEHLPLSPSKLADPLGMCVLRVLRSFSGFPDLHAPETICAGMDHANPASNDDGPHWDGEGNDDEAQSTRGWHEIGQSSFSQDEVEGSLNLLSVAKRLNDGSPVGELCADMLVLRTRPWANADILLGMTYAGVIRLLGTIGVSVRVNEVDARILGRIRAEVQVAIEEYIEVEGNNQVSEAFVSGHERIARSGI